MKEIHRFILIGTGHVGDIHARVIQGLENAELAAVVDKNESVGRKYAAQYGCHYYASLQEAIQKEDFSIASICTPSYSHCRIAGELVKAGKHVIIEKPVDIDLQAVDELDALSRSNHVKVCTIFQHRFDDSMMRVKKAIDDGRLGKLFFGACHTKWYRDEKYYASGGWRGTWKYDGGGALINQSIHYIDLLLYLMGEASEIYGSCGTFAHKTIEVEDLGAALVKFKSGGIGIIEGTTAAYPGLYAELSVYGEKGSFVIRNDRLVQYNVMGMSAEEEDYMLERKEVAVGASEAMSLSIEPHKRQYEDMIQAIETGREPLVNCAEGRKSLEVVLSIYESWKNDLPVKLGK
ncbi:MAG: Gfo/Idh/MocA family oxidoreductase [Eubacteriales bacterium]|nr:Gfo/Idh/MocA family oxidoreductase [Eubacteriales bacterium]